MAGTEVRVVRRGTANGFLETIGDGSKKMPQQFAIPVHQNYLPDTVGAAEALRPRGPAPSRVYAAFFLSMAPIMGRRAEEHRHAELRRGSAAQRRPGNLPT
jgi:hypothetical protein